MPARALRRQILLSTTMIVGALTGYASRAYAACAPSGGSTYSCSGINGTEQDITVNNATVSTVAGFSVITPDPYGVNIDAYGALSFTDANNSTLTAATALRMNVKGDYAGTPGGITINTDGTLTALNEDGIAAYNNSGGTGAISITANGRVRGYYGAGIKALNTSGSNIIVTTGSNAVNGQTYGIDARNKGTGYTTVTVMGYVYGYPRGISAKNYAGTTDLTVTTESGSKVRGDMAIYAANAGSGDLRITAGGEVHGTIGIDARLTGTGDGYITTNGTVAGYFRGIVASGGGSGTWTIEANGNVTSVGGESIFIGANNGASVTTAYGATVSGYSDGIAGSTQSGALSIVAHGDVTGKTGSGIDVSVDNSTYGTDLSVTTDGTVTGYVYGIHTSNGELVRRPSTSAATSPARTATVSMPQTWQAPPISASPRLPGPPSAAERVSEPRTPAAERQKLLPMVPSPARGVWELPP